MRPAFAANILRRILLALLTAIIVARPFVRAEDPGMLSDFSDPGGMLLTMFTFIVGIGWAVEGPQAGFFPFWVAVLIIVARPMGVTDTCP